MRRSAAARAALAVAVLVPVVVLAAVVGVSTGAGALSLRAALQGQEPDATVLFRLRVPRVLLAAEVGAALSVAGVALQALLRNPLADPFVFGLSGAFGAGRIHGWWMREGSRARSTVRSTMRVAGRPLSDTNASARTSTARPRRACSRAIWCAAWRIRRA